MNEIFISYAWGDNSETGKQREEIVNRLCETLRAKGFTITRDKDHLNYRGSIRKFMQRIGKGNFVITVISDKYLKSEYCMFEAAEIMKNEDAKDRMFPIVLPDAQIYDIKGQTQYINHWITQKEELNQEFKSIQQPTLATKILERIKDVEEISYKLNDFMALIADMNVLTSQIHLDTNFKALEKALAEKIKQNAEKHQRDVAVLVVGTGKYNIPEVLYKTTKALGNALASEGYKLVCGGWEGVDYVVADEFSKILKTRDIRLSSRLTQVVSANREPIFKGGSIEHVKQGVKEWIESVKYAQAVILLGGEGGTYETFEFAAQDRVPVFPVAGTGGDAKRVFDEMLQNWDEKLVDDVSKEEFFAKLNVNLDNDMGIELVVDNVMDLLKRL
jgi:predicted Rossmann-fold nucleotide-binding protein